MHNSAYDSSGGYGMRETITVEKASDFVKAAGRVKAVVEKSCGEVRKRQEMEGPRAEISDKICYDEEKRNFRQTRIKFNSLKEERSVKQEKKNLNERKKKFFEKKKLETAAFVETSFLRNLENSKMPIDKQTTMAPVVFFEIEKEENERKKVSENKREKCRIEEIDNLSAFWLDKSLKFSDFLSRYNFIFFPNFDLSENVCFCSSIANILDEICLGLSQLLMFRLNVFWCNIMHNKNLKSFLKTFLRNSLRNFDLDFLASSSSSSFFVFSPQNNNCSDVSEKECSIDSVENSKMSSEKLNSHNLSRLGHIILISVLKIFRRMSSPFENDNEYLSNEKYEQIMRQYNLVDLGKLCDIMNIYGEPNFVVVEEIVWNCFNYLPFLSEELDPLRDSLLESLVEAYNDLQTCLSELVAFHGKDLYKSVNRFSSATSSSSSSFSSTSTSSSSSFSTSSSSCFYSSRLNLRDFQEKYCQIIKNFSCLQDACMSLHNICLFFPSKICNILLFSLENSNDLLDNFFFDSAFLFYLQKIYVLLMTEKFRNICIESGSNIFISTNVSSSIQQVDADSTLINNVKSLYRLSLANVRSVICRCIVDILKKVLSVAENNSDQGKGKGFLGNSERESIIDKFFEKLTTWFFDIIEQCNESNQYCSEELSEDLCRGGILEFFDLLRDFENLDETRVDFLESIVCKSSSKQKYQKKLNRNTEKEERLQRCDFEDKQKMKQNFEHLNVGNKDINILYGNEYKKSEEKLTKMLQNPLNNKNMSLAVKNKILFLAEKYNDEEIYNDDNGSIEQEIYDYIVPTSLNNFETSENYESEGEDEKHHFVEEELKNKTKEKETFRRSDFCSDNCDRGFKMKHNRFSCESQRNDKRELRQYRKGVLPSGGRMRTEKGEDSRAANTEVLPQNKGFAVTQENLRYKEKNKAHISNHNRKDRHMRKMYRGML